MLVTSMIGNFERERGGGSNLQGHDIHTNFRENAFTVAIIIIIRTGNKVLSPGELPASLVDPALQ
jgi:hypothetical protein